MTSRDFCYWLQGFFELAVNRQSFESLDGAQVDIVRRHLALVFKHEIDPSMGPKEHQAELDGIHYPPPFPDGWSPGDDIICATKPDEPAPKPKPAPITRPPDGSIKYRC